jgi:hypothetical protein
MLNVSEIYYADDLRHSIVVAVTDLLAKGYQVDIRLGSATLSHPDGHIIECVHKPGKSMWWASSPTVPTGHTLSGSTGSWVSCSGPPQAASSPHGPHSPCILKEAVRNNVVTGVSLERWQFNANEVKKRHQGVCVTSVLHERRSPKPSAPGHPQHRRSRV